MHARASSQYSVHIGDKEAIALILSARLCRADIATPIVVQELLESCCMVSQATPSSFDLVKSGTFVVPTKVEAGFGTEAFKSVLSRRYRDGWTVCKLVRNS